MEKVLLVGTGNVGSHILEFIARDDNKLEWVIGDIDENRARLKCNNASIGAAHHGKDPVFHIKKVDLLNIEKNWCFKKGMVIKLKDCSLEHY